MPGRRTIVEWTEAAEAHLDEIRAYIARDSPLNARRFIARIKKAVQNLRRFPHMGEILEAHEDVEVREIYVKSYRVIFRVRPGFVRVLAVLHGRRNFRGFTKYLEPGQ